jgi:Acyl-CoA synthetases (AMP-forming)/AMP-acid ligases II
MSQVQKSVAKNHEAASRPWLASYPEGVPHEIDPTPIANLAELVEAAMREHARRIAFHCTFSDITYAELDRLSAAFACHLQQHGFKRGDRFALMMPNMLQYPIALMGCLRLGLTIVNCNPLYTARELAHQLQDSGARGICIFENAAHVLQSDRAD